jgi:catechol 2,3-dioxygenase-like lactoylglutathione lyase family enzyme
MARPMQTLASMETIASDSLGRSEARASVIELCLSVLDLERMVGFYRRLGFAPISSTATRVQLQLGGELLGLSCRPGGKPAPSRLRADDLAFQHFALVVRDVDEALRSLPGVDALSAGPQTIPEDNLVAAGVRAIYLLDPEGRCFELISFPRGKGDPRWQRRDALFLGIDHTAIVVRDTARSEAFYSGLGLTVRARSVNRGLEQEALSGVDGAVVRITSLRGIGGPGVELLEYLAPRSGRPRPELNEADPWWWEIAVARTEEAAAPRLMDPDQHCVRVQP